jgi:hypothetical protein
MNSDIIQKMLNDMQGLSSHSDGTGEEKGLSRSGSQLIYTIFSISSYETETKFVQHDAENCMINVKFVPVLKDYTVEEQTNGQVNAWAALAKRGEPRLQ